MKILVFKLVSIANVFDLLLILEYGNSNLQIKCVKTNIIVHLKDVVNLYTQYTIEIQLLPSSTLQIIPMKLTPKT